MLVFTRKLLIIEHLNVRANQLASRTICVVLYRHILTILIIKQYLWINKYSIAIPNLITFQFRLPRPYMAL